MPVARTLGLGLLAALSLVACGAGGGTTGGAGPTTTVPTASAVTTAGTATTGPAAASSSSSPRRLEQPAIWPASGVVFSTPEDAARDFVRQVLAVEPVLGEFRQGDSRSGEIEVRSPPQGGTSVVRSLLLLRQLGPDDAWFVLAAANDEASITSPAADDDVRAGAVVVDGTAPGFDGAVVVSAFPAGDRSAEIDRAEIDQVVAPAGAFGESEPFTVTLDLSSAVSGETVVLLVRADTGGSDDPGEFGAIPVTISG